jgi:hypothetical protein
VTAVAAAGDEILSLLIVMRELYAWNEQATMAIEA